MVLCMSWSDPKSPFVDMSCAAACIVTCHQNSTCRHPQCFEYTFQSTPRSHRAHPGACVCAPGRLCPNLQSFSRSHFPCTHTTEEISTHIITHAPAPMHSLHTKALQARTPASSLIRTSEPSSHPPPHLAPAKSTINFFSNTSTEKKPTCDARRAYWSGCGTRISFAIMG